MDILQGIGNLFLSQGTLAPVGEGMGFGQFGADHAMNELGVAHLRPIANHGRRQLRVEHRCRDLTDVSVQQFEILLAGMDDLFNMGIRQHLPQAVQRADGWDINDSGEVVRCDLDQLQTRHKAVLTDKLRIQREMRALAKATAEVFQSVGVRDVVEVRRAHCSSQSGRPEVKNQRSPCDSVCMKLKLSLRY